MRLDKYSGTFSAVVIVFALVSTFLSPSLANDGNEPPQVDFHWEPSSDLKTNQEIHFYDDSTDDGEIIAWEWNFGDDSYAIEQNPTHEYESKGVYTVTLTVIDNNGSMNSTSKHITIHNRPPIADAGPDQVVNETLVSFDGSGSTDTDGTINTYRWYFGDGSSALGAVVNHNYTSNGIYNVTLNVTDNDGASDEDTCKVTVDTISPETNISVDGDKGKNEWYLSNVTVTLLPHDATSGIDATYYLLNNGTWTVYTSPLTISHEGENTLKFYSVDKAGNKEAVNTTTIKIDKTSPAIEIRSPKQGYLYFFGRQLFPTLRNKTIAIGKVTVEVDVTNTPSGIKYVLFYVDGNLKYNDTESPYAWKWGMAFGRHTLKVEAFDKAGHNASKELDVTIFSLFPGKNSDMYSEENISNPTSS